MKWLSSLVFFFFFFCSFCSTSFLVPSWTRPSLRNRRRRASTTTTTTTDRRWRSRWRRRRRPRCSRSCTHSRSTTKISTRWGAGGTATPIGRRPTSPRAPSIRSTVGSEFFYFILCLFFFLPNNWCSFIPTETFQVYWCNDPSMTVVRKRSFIETPGNEIPTIESINLTWDRKKKSNRAGFFFIGAAYQLESLESFVFVPFFFFVELHFCANRIFCDFVAILLSFLEHGCVMESDLFLVPFHLINNPEFSCCVNKNRHRPLILIIDSSFRCL